MAKAVAQVLSEEGAQEEGRAPEISKSFGSQRCVVLRWTEADVSGQLSCIARWPKLRPAFCCASRERMNPSRRHYNSHY